nr:MAG TPA: hypothetical protein [Caudoviricetes sp.]
MKESLGKDIGQPKIQVKKFTCVLGSFLLNPFNQ